MAIFQIIGLVLIIVLLMVMFAQARPWKQAKIQGKVIQVASLKFWQRVQFYRSTLLALAMGALLGRVSGLFSDPVVAMLVCFTLAIVCLPMKYTFTTHGVSVGSAIFRPWSEFSGIQLKPERIILEHPSLSGRLILFVKPVDVKNVLARIKTLS
jgi:hypothetical protein